jgi:hypothetical protein
MEPDKDLLEKLAEAFHEVFCEDLRAKGWTYGPVTREDKKEHSSLKPYAELSEDEKEQNRNNVRDIPNKLAIVGYIMLPARSGETPAQFQKDEVEKLAEEEHERWRRQKLDARWQPGKQTVKAKKIHKDLVDWEKLPEEEREKDRVLVRGISRIIAKAGYTMVKLS